MNGSKHIGNLEKGGIENKNVKLALLGILYLDRVGSF